MRLSELGVSVDLPRGWEGRIRGLEARDRGRGWSLPAGQDRPVAHFANFALPPEPGDFGTEVVHLMGDEQAFIALIDYGPESAGTALFSEQGLPRNLRATSFHPRSLQRTLPGQAGFQHFFTERGRPFCLYVVLGSFKRSRGVIGEINRTLASITIGAPE